jgi:hypothetical protein
MKPTSGFEPLTPSLRGVVNSPNTRQQLTDLLQAVLSERRAPRLI